LTENSLLEEALVDGREDASEELIDRENSGHEEGAAGDFWKGKDATNERNKEVELHFDFEGPSHEKERVVLAVEDEAVAIDETSGVVGEPDEAALIKSDGEEKEEGERDEVGDFNADEAALKVFFDKRFFFAVEKVRGVGQRENEPRDEEKNLHAKPAAPDEGMRGVFQPLDRTGVDKPGHGAWLISRREKSVRVKDDNKNDRKAAEAIDLRKVAARGGLALEGREEAVGPGRHFISSAWCPF
jgi:hypothetical protein